MPFKPVGISPTFTKTGAPTKVDVNMNIRSIGPVSEIHMVIVYVYIIAQCIFHHSHYIITIG